MRGKRAWSGTYLDHLGIKPTPTSTTQDVKRDKFQTRAPLTLSSALSSFFITNALNHIVKFKRRNSSSTFGLLRSFQPRVLDYQFCLELHQTTNMKDYGHLLGSRVRETMEPFVKRRWKNQRSEFWSIGIRRKQSIA